MHVLGEFDGLGPETVRPARRIAQPGARLIAPDQDLCIRRDRESLHGRKRLDQGFQLTPDHWIIRPAEYSMAGLTQGSGVFRSCPVLRGM